MRLDRKWMYERHDGRWIKEEFVNGVWDFIEFSKQQDSYKETSTMRCPCYKCKNMKYLVDDEVREHLYRNGFCENYYEWVYHGEHYTDVGPLSGRSNPYRDMVLDALGPRDETIGDEVLQEVEEDPHPEAKKFFEMLRAAEEPLYAGSRLSVLEMASKHSQPKGS